MIIIPSTRPIEDHMPPDDEEARTTPASLVIRLDRRKHTVEYHAGDTLLETARRGGLRPPSSCEAGDCATCMAHLESGTVHMRANNALSAEDLDDGFVLTCQSLPTSLDIVVNYDF
jgi:3-ketosteroid 9alpha-monooxygenase subunit B